MKPRRSQLIVIACLVLAGCGADGPPQAPATAAAQPGITVSGEARIGIVSN